MSEKKWVKLDALSSITAYELAQIIGAFGIMAESTMLEKMPKECRKHFQPAQPKDDDISVDIEVD
mgnify:CR=1 FL=1